MAGPDPLPYFPLPPGEYSPRYFSELTRAFATYMQQSRVPSPMFFRGTGDSAAQSGVMLWDPAGGYPVVSVGNEWREVLLADGYAQFGRATDVTAAVADTAYAVEYDTPALASGVSKDAGDATRLVFADKGVFSLSFTAQISSSGGGGGGGSTIAFRFWPRVNGVDVTGSTMLAKLHSSDASTVVSRTMLFEMDASDYIQVMWAVDDTAGSLVAAAATAYAPSAPSTTLSINRVRAG